MMTIDTETTGTDRTRDQIVELAIRFNDHTESWRFKPSIPIPAEATAVHGITDADVADCQPFSDAAAEIVTTLGQSDTWLLYNGRFDIDMINAEMARCGRDPLYLPPFIFDALRLWQSCEPRKLTDAVARFLGRAHNGAHSAAADTRATAELWQAMLTAFGLTDKTREELAALADPLESRHTWCGPTDDLLWRDGVVVLNFGKHKGTPIHELDAGMLRWLIENARAKHVRATATLALTPSKFLERLRARRVG